MPRHFKRRNTKGRKKPARKTYGARKRTGGKVRRVVNAMEHNKLTTRCIPKGPDQLFPDRMCAKLRNRFPIVWTGAAGAANGFAAGGNFLHNPISSGPISGANPFAVGSAVSIYGLPNMLSTGGTFNSVGPYFQYRVISSAIKFQLENTSAAAADAAVLTLLPVTLGAFNQLGNVNSQTYLNLAEMPYAKMWNLAGTTMNKGVRGQHAMSTARQFALKYKSSLEDDQYVGSYGTNPTQQWLWVFGWFPQTSNNTTATMVVTQEYWIEFYNRNLLPTGGG